MKRLFLLRHAKTEPENPGGDHARVLIERGMSDAALMGRCLKDGGFEPDLVLCSSSARTRQTWSIVAPLLGHAPKVEYLDTLYLASTKRILAIAEGAPDSVKSLMLIGHNPGIEETSALLARKPETAEERANILNMREKFSTGSLAVLDFDAVSWKHVAPHLGALAAFVRPKFLRND